MMALCNPRFELNSIKFQTVITRNLSLPDYMNQRVFFDGILYELTQTGRVEPKLNTQR